MKKPKRQLKGAPTRPALDAGTQSWNAFTSKKRRKTTRRARYALFAATAFATIIATLMLILFGVGANGKPFLESLGMSWLADKISAAFSGMDFPSFVFDGKEPSGPSGGAQTKPSGDIQGPSGAENGDIAADAEVTDTDIYAFDYSAVPEGNVPVVPMDLSLSAYGPLYINNLTGYSPDISRLLKKELCESDGYRPLSISQNPVVLIVHTHGTEAYLDENTRYVPEGTEYSRSSDTAANVVSLGKIIADTLNRRGIPTAHCSIMHDSVQYRDSYSRAEETIRKYLSEFPSIQVVIDVHRDSIVRSNGEIVRPVVAYGDKTAAQVMCVVGSDWEGEDCPNWENNLSLALKFREKINSACNGICRPTFLKGHTYNQEIAPYSMLIEVGSSGNRLSEAIVSAQLTGEALAALFDEIF